jgi:hypothetical protein
MANEVTVYANNGPLAVSVSDFKDALGNPTVAPDAVPTFVVVGPASAAPNGQTAMVTLTGEAGDVSVSAQYAAFTLTGTIHVTAGPAVTATLNISA